MFLMAGLDGIQNKIDPGEALDADRDFLKKGDVFSNSYIDEYIDLRRKECKELAEAPHPIEFKLYYSVCLRNTQEAGCLPDTQ